QNKSLHAITAIGVARQRQTLKNQPEDAEILLGGLYFEYGLIDEAEEILTQLLDEKTTDETKNIIWFNLARVQYHKNNYQQAEQLLSRISESLSAQRQAQKITILTNIHIQNQLFEQAAKSASMINPDTVWSAYSEYNLGVSLSTAEQHEQAQQWLSKLISRQTQDEEIRALQNAARLVSGLISLRQNQPADAIKYLGDIDTSSPLTNKALLATGWAWSQLSNPEKALTYWLTLAEKEQDDGATQEAYLAIAYAYEQLGSNALAIQHYEQALKKLDRTLRNLEKATQSIEQMELINVLYRDNIIQPGLHNSFDRNLPEHISTPFLHQMFAGKAFQQALLNYQQLLEIHNSLIQWKNDVPAFELMLVERINSFQSKRKLVTKTTDFSELEKLQQKRDRLAQEVKQIEQNDDYFALADEDERDYLEQLNELQNLISKLERHQDLSEEKQKFRLMSGLLEWDISTDYP
ncbi:MAG: tetratricopeptide repeat protein, partial [Gammaproteobacteria bacterium]|nr:tetratricopeptide repeat protein [Gammaproteobacteria bacterium]